MTTGLPLAEYTTPRMSDSSHDVDEQPAKPKVSGILWRSTLLGLVGGIGLGFVFIGKGPEPIIFGFLGAVIGIVVGFALDAGR